MSRDRPALTRRGAIAAMAGGAAALAAGPLDAAPAPAIRDASRGTGRLRQAVARWPFASMPLDALCKAAAGMGLEGIDLLTSDEWERVREFGLVCSMGTPTKRSDFIATGLNDPAHHALLLRELETAIPLARRHAVPNVITMFGNRNGRSDAAGIAACVAALRRIAPLAEEQGVTVCLEMLNSKVDHKDFQGDRTAFGVAVVKEVASRRVKLLYDIYHMQIMEGDVIRTIRDNRAHLAHFHTAGVPGRHELDGAQELQYPAVARAIADTGFTGFFAHEFVPTRDPMTSLREAVEVCRV